MLSIPRRRQEALAGEAAVVTAGQREPQLRCAERSSGVSQVSGNEGGTVRRRVATDAPLRPAWRPSPPGSGVLASKKPLLASHEKPWFLHVGSAWVLVRSWVTA